LPTPGKGSWRCESQDWHPDGSTSELSVIEGTHSKIASTPDEFMALLNTQEWQEEHLLSLLVYGLHERKTIPSQGQCYGFAPHPLLSGRIDIDQAMILEIGAWQGITPTRPPLNR
jgi:hypothetical protein